MKKAELDFLLSTATEQQRLKIKILHDAVVDSMKQYNETHEPKFLKAWKSAENELVNYCGQIKDGFVAIEDVDTLKKQLMATMPTEIIALIFGLSKSRIRQLTLAGMPKAGRNKYRLADCVQWYAEYLKTKESPDDDLKEQRIRYLKAKADRATIDAELSRLAVVPVEQVASIWAHHINIAKSKLLGLPTTLASTLSKVTEPAKIQKESNRIINEILHDLSNDKPVIK